MSIGIRVPAEWQFGQHIPVGEARAGSLQRAAMAVIQKHLFCGHDLSFAEAGTRFEKRWAGYKASQPQIAALLEGLYSAKPEGSSNGEALITLALYGLCWSLSGGQISTRVPEALELENQDSEREADGADDGSERGEEKSDLGDDHGPPEIYRADYLRLVPLAEVEWVVADLLRRSVSKRSSSTVSDDNAALNESTINHLRLLSKAILTCTVDVLPEVFKIVKLAIGSNGDGKGSFRYYVTFPRAMSGRLRGLALDFPYQLTLQPLKTPVQYGDGADDTPDVTHVPLLGYRQTNGLLRNFLQQALAGTKSSFRFLEYLRAVNVQQAVTWRINAELAGHARLLIELSHPREQWSDDLKALVSGLSRSELAELLTWTAENFYRRGAGNRKSFEAGGEFLDHILAREALKDLTTPNAGGSRPAFFLPWKADYRGRIYAETPWFTPQGGDVQRALFEFAAGHSLDEAGVAALRRHGANLVRRAQILNDLDIRDRQVVTLDERERWVERHEADIVKSAESPLTHSFWRRVASKPMQFLAFCCAYRRWKDNPGVLVHLPVQIDGTCNGLQHIAVLTGDSNLASAVNVLPRKDGLPADIYMELATEAQVTVGKVGDILNLGKRLPDRLRDLVLAADAMIAAQPDWRKWLDRSVAKKVVMTVPYGASDKAQARNVLTDEIAGRLQAQLLVSEGKTVGVRDPGDELWATAEKWTTVAAADEDTHNALWNIKKGSFKALQRRRGSRLQPVVLQMQTVGSLLSLTLVLHLRAALDRRFPVAGEFKSWLSTIARHCDGLPLLWLTPLGLPVCQDGFRIRKSSLNARVGNKVIRIGTSTMTELVSEKDQAQALLPNLIHCLDASHLALTIDAAENEGINDIGTIHDCLLCHPNNAGRLGQIVKETFCKLYESNPGKTAPAFLKDWSEWMYVIARIAALEEPFRVKGPLEHPGGIGEVLLRDLANSKNEDTAAAARIALNILDDVRRLPSARRALAAIIIDYAVRVLPKSSATEGPTRTNHRPFGVRGWKGLIKQWPLPPSSSDFELKAGGMSGYFFS